MKVIAEGSAMPAGFPCLLRLHVRIKDRRDHAIARRRIVLPFAPFPGLWIAGCTLRDSPGLGPYAFHVETVEWNVRESLFDLRIEDIEFDTGDPDDIDLTGIDFGPEWDWKVYCRGGATVSLT